MDISSTAFQNNENIPAKYTCDGKNINPPLTFSETPVDTKSLVLIVEDPDAPSKPNFTHWLLYNIPSATMQILENETPENTGLGINDLDNTGYGGPCPPSGKHRYYFRLYALDTTLDLPDGATKEEVKEAMKDHIIESAELMGLYERSS